jgi:hypothetical protein
MNPRDRQLYQRLASLLGKCDNDEAFKAFLAEFGEPSFTYEVGPAKFYRFNKLGFGICYSNKHNRFCALDFHFVSRKSKHEDIEPFRGDLPSGIEPTDSRGEVERKLGISPYYASSPKNMPIPEGKSCGSVTHWEKYDIPPYRFTFVFDAKGERLRLLSIAEPQFVNS